MNKIFCNFITSDKYLNELLEELDSLGANDVLVEELKSKEVDKE